MIIIVASKNTSTNSNEKLAFFFQESYSKREGIIVVRLNLWNHLSKFLLRFILKFFGGL